MNNGCPQLFQEPLPRCVGKRLSMRGSMRSTDMRAPLNQLRAGGAGLRLTFVPHFDAASATSRMLRLGGKCYTWVRQCYAWEVQKPLISLVCYGVTLGKAVFGGVRGEGSMSLKDSIPQIKSRNQKSKTICAELSKWGQNPQTKDQGFACRVK